MTLDSDQRKTTTTTTTTKEDISTKERTYQQFFDYKETSLLTISQDKIKEKGGGKMVLKKDKWTIIYNVTKIKIRYFLFKDTYKYIFQKNTCTRK